jgi:GNAT superfamily N-acetyltransferase
MDIHRFLPGQEIPGFDHTLLSSQLANEHLVIGDGFARCTIWWDTVPNYPPEKLGVIGHFQTQSPEAGSSILEHAVQRLREAGCTLAVGPMDGNTWRSYRVLTERGAEPPFFMEPDNPDTWPPAFDLAGFSTLATYSSLLVTDLTRRDPRTARTLDRLQRDGVTIRQLDPARFEDDLRSIYQVSIVSFSENYMYTELSESAFLNQYTPYKEKIRPELVLIAEHDGQPVGYLFAIPDYAEAVRGEPVRTVIGKTLAILPGRRYAGLGVVLADLLHERSHAMGFIRLIHALQHESNKVRNMSNHFGSVMRRYTLYSRTL